MKLIASFAALSIALTIASVAGAQQPTQRGQAQPSSSQPSQIKTNDYTEQAVGGDQMIKFTGDELEAPPNSWLGSGYRPLPGAIRVQLIRPRLNFVPELLKSVENL